MAPPIKDSFQSASDSPAKDMYELSGSFFVPAFLSHAAQSISLAVSSTYIIDHLLGDRKVLGMVLACGSGGVVLGNMPAGSFTSAFGPKRAALFSALLGCVGASLLVAADASRGLAPVSGVGEKQIFSIVLYALGALFIGTSTSFGVVARTVGVAEAQLPPERIGCVSSWMSGMNRAGNALGPLMGGLSAMADIGMAFYLQLFVYCLYGLWVFFLMPGRDVRAFACDKIPREVKFRNLHGFRDVLACAATVIFALGFFRESRKFLMPVVGQQRKYSVVAIGSAVSVSFFGDTVMIPVAGVLLDSIGRWRTIGISIAVMGLGIYIFCNVSWGHVSEMSGSYVFGVLVAGVGNGLSAGAVVAMSVALAPDSSQRASVVGLFRMLNTGTDVVVPLLLGCASHWVNTELCGVVLLCLGCFCGLALAARSRDGEELSASTEDGEEPLVAEPFAAEPEPESLKVPDIDFVIPVKKVGMLTRTVIESVFLHYAPRNMYIVSRKSELETIELLSADWNIPKSALRYVDEENFFLGTLQMRMCDFMQYYDSSREKEKRREFGWWWQQLLKLGAGMCIPGLSQDFYVWDGDLIVLKPWPLRVRRPTGAIYHVAILQEAARSAFNRGEYEASIRELLGVEAAYPQEGGTFVTHHMPMNKGILEKLVRRIDSRLPGNLPWPAKLLKTSERRYRMSEYMLYCTFVKDLQSHGHQRVPFAHHCFEAYGKKGVRVRENEVFVQDLEEAQGLPRCGCAYEQLQDFLCRPGSVGNQYRIDGMTHLQVEHVYHLSSPKKHSPHKMCGSVELESS